MTVELQFVEVDRFALYHAGLPDFELSVGNNVHRLRLDGSWLLLDLYNNGGIPTMIHGSHVIRAVPKMGEFEE